MTFTEAANSVEALLTIESYQSGSSEIAALVLLSAWNSYDFAVPVAELARLDPDNYRHALRVLTLRYSGHEPHTVIENGDARFKALHDRWAHLKITEQTGAAA
ncbi:hypothetical protein JF535_13330 [Microbulbifer salipaludis]|uniref:DUF7673 domain-containing protein n=1 Tax=Microbulbifer salipaludis TaxID=187980 RepID=A0ABS3E9U5_9GAMM|nr:hypothetical protein [Microbulbifer salipaludis]MBN8431834.1 hypothetical protein [Microbulbifer salipaludis]